MTERLIGEVEKAWGREVIFASTDDYCGKYLIFSKAGNKFSMHFHREKDETWNVLQGSFLLEVIDTKTAKRAEHTLKRGDTWRNEPLLPHRLTALEDNSIIIEVSTADSVEDNYRILPGDSQNG
jgi:quercetin dioxygenase-like cupin family protein